MSKIYVIGDEEELSEDLQKELPNRIIAELEKIKAEILSYKKYKDFSCMGTVYDFEIKKVFDKRIAELKGENKCNLMN